LLNSKFKMLQRKSSLISSSSPDLHTSELWESIRTKELNTAWQLLHQGTNPNVRDQSTGMTPLIWACLEGNVALVMLLFTKGASVDAQDHLGQTALHKAVSQGHLQITTFLLKAKASTEIQDNQNRTAEQLAFETHHLECFRLLVGVKGGAEKRSSLLSSVSHANAKASKKEQEKKEKQRKVLEKKEKKLQEKGLEIQDKIADLNYERERLQAIPDDQISKKEKKAMLQLFNKLTKLQTENEKYTGKLRTIRLGVISETNQDSDNNDKGQHWIDLVQS